MCLPAMSDVLVLLSRVLTSLAAGRRRSISTSLASQTTLAAYKNMEQIVIFLCRHSTAICGPQIFRLQLTHP